MNGAEFVSGGGRAAPSRRQWSAGLEGICAAVAVAVLASCGPQQKVENRGTPGDAKNNMAGGEIGVPKSGATARTLRTPVVLFFGTSITAGAGLDPEQAFPALVEKKADSAGIPIRAINAGQSGETTAGAARRIDWVLRTPADIIVIETGANDALRGLSPDAARANLERVVAAVKRKQPKAKILLVQMEAPPNFGTAYTRSFRAIYSDIARRENLTLVPFILDRVAGIAPLNQADGIHPNAAGERIVAENVWRALEPIVAQLDRGVKSG